MIKYILACAVWVAIGMLLAACRLKQPDVSSPQDSGRKPALERLLNRERAKQVGDYRQWARPLEGLDSAGLREMFVNEPRGSVVEAKRWKWAVDSAVAVWVLAKDEHYRNLATNAYKAALGELAEKPEEFFRKQVTSKGSVDHRNNYARKLVDTTDLYALRDACEHFAMLYYLTGEKMYARKSAILLARFAEELPKWPVYYPTRVDLAAKKAGGMIGHMNQWYDFKEYPQKGPGMNLWGDATGPWGIWYYEDLEAGMPLARAYDVIHASGEMQQLGVLASIEAMLRGHVEFQKVFPETFSNMDSVQKIGILTFAEILGQPEWAHEVVWWMKAICKTQFYADGWWHEGSPAYMGQLFYRLPENICRRFLQGYSDPPGFISKLDGTRFDNLDMFSVMARPFARSEAVLPKVALPSGLVQVLGDTHFGQRAPGPAMEKAQSVLFGCRGHAILGTGKGKNMAQAALSFGGTHGHTHDDGLNLILFAKGKELLSETTYSPMFTNTTREWHTITPGHVTVVVNELSQNGEQKRERQQEDAIPGIPDWPWRWYGHGHGNMMNDGFLRLFNTQFDRVQVVEADAERRYSLPDGAPLQRYRRTIALVKISDEDVYVVDIFRVKGGRMHDYMLHSCLEAPHTAKVSIPLPKQRNEPLYKYITGVREGSVDGDWHVTFSMDDGSAKLRTYMLGEPGTKVLMGEGPAMRRDGTAPFLAVRRTGKESVYVAVHHPYTDEPVVQKVEMLELDPHDNQAVAIRVTLPNRRDTIISTADKKPWPKRQCGKTFFSGGFAHMAEGGQSNSWLYLVDDFELRMEDKVFRGATSFEGILERTRRIEAGDEFNAFETAVSLPDDGSLDGRTLMVEFYDDSLTWIEQQNIGGLLVQSFRIDKITRSNGRTLIHTLDEPGMTITPGLVKLEYYPCWGIKGEAKFKIAGSTLLIRKTNGEYITKSTAHVDISVNGKLTGK